MTPNGRRPARLYPTIAALAVGLGVAGFFDIGTAYPHDPDRPELNGWFKNLKNKAGESCCDGGDGQHAEADWDMAKGGYGGSLKHPHRPNESAKWFDVPYSAAIDKLNISGIAIVWRRRPTTWMEARPRCGATSLREPADDHCSIRTHSLRARIRRFGSVFRRPLLGERG